MAVELGEPFSLRRKEGPLDKDGLRLPREGPPLTLCRKRYQHVGQGLEGEKDTTFHNNNPHKNQEQEGDKHWLLSPKSGASYFY